MCFIFDLFIYLLKIFHWSEFLGSVWLSVFQFSFLTKRIKKCSTAFHFILYYTCIDLSVCTYDRAGTFTRLQIRIMKVTYDKGTQGSLKTLNQLSILELPFQTEDIFISAVIIQKYLRVLVYLLTFSREYEGYGKG